MNKVSQTIARLSVAGEGLIVNPWFERLVSNTDDATAGQATIDSWPSTAAPVYAVDGNGSRYKMRLPSDVFEYIPQDIAPGWQPFGHARGLGFVLDDTNVGPHRFNDRSDQAYWSDLRQPPVMLDNPLNATLSATKNMGQCLTLKKGGVSGIFQKLPGGAALLGRKLRIYGAYRTLMKDFSASEVPLGVSLYLKGRLRTVIPTGSPKTDTAGTADQAPWADTITGATSPINDNVTAGDVVWVQGANLVYRINSATTTSIFTLTPSTSTNMGNKQLALGRQDPDGTGTVPANWMGDRGVFIRKDTNLVGAVVRMSHDDATFRQGVEWFTPGIDSVVYPYDASDILGYGSDASITTGTLTSASAKFLTNIPNLGGTPMLNAYVYVAGHGAYAIISIPSETTLTLGGSPPTGVSGLNYAIVMEPQYLDSGIFMSGAALLFGSGVNPDAALESYVPGAAPLGLNDVSGVPVPTNDQGKIWYLDSTDWTDNPSANGVSHLFDDLNTADGQVHYFEEVVEIPPDLALDEDEIYLIALPTAPANFDSLQSFASIVYYGLQAELIPEEASGGNGTEDRMVTAMVRGTDRLYRSDLAPGGLAYREPLWVPVKGLIDLHKFYAEDFDNMGTGADGRIYTFADSASGRNRLYFGDNVEVGTLINNTSDDGTDYLLVPLPDLPPGSIVSKIQFSCSGSVRGRLTNPATVSATLVQLTNTAGYLNSSWQLNDLSETVDVSSVATHTLAMSDTTADGVIYRHRLGVVWPLQDRPANVDNVQYHPAKLALRLAIYEGLGIVSGQWAFIISNASFEAWVDARAVSGRFAPNGWGS